MWYFVIQKEKTAELTQIFNQSLKIGKILHIRNKEAVHFSHMSHILREGAWMMGTKQAVSYGDGTTRGASSSLFLRCCLLLRGCSILTFQLLIRINILPVCKPEIWKTKLAEDLKVSQSSTTHRSAWLRNAFTLLFQRTVNPLKEARAPFLCIYEHMQSASGGWGKNSSLSQEA